MSNNPNNIFNNTGNSTNPFTGNKPPGNQPTGGIFSTNSSVQGATNIFATNNQTQSNTTNPFGNPQAANNPPAQNSIFNQGNQANNTTAPLFGNKAPENKPAGGLFNNTQNNQAQQNNTTNPPATNNQQPANQGAPSIFSNNAANQQPAQGTNPIGPSGLGGNFGNKPSQFPSSGNAFGANNTQAPTGNQQQNPPAQQPPANNLFGGNKPTTNILGQKPAETQPTAQTAPGNNPTSQNPPAQNPPANNLFGNNNNATTSNTGGGIFANNAANNTANNATNTANQQPAQQPAQQNTNQPATSATGVNLLGNKMTTSTTVPSQQPGNNLFNNAASTNNAQTNPTQNQNPGQQQQNQPAGQQQNQQNNSGNPGQQQGQSQGQQAPTFGNQQQGGQQQQNNPPQNVNPVEMQFNRNANKTVKEFLDESRMNLDQIYCDMLKCSNSLIRYQQTRQENIKIFTNFEGLKPQLTNIYQNNLQILMAMEQQQDEIENNLGALYDQLRPERFEHPLISCMDDCQKLSKEIFQLQLDNDKESQTQSTHPSHEQLMLMCASLGKIESDVDNMNELLEICFPQMRNNQNESYEGNYRNGYSNRQRGYEI